MQKNPINSDKKVSLVSERGLFASPACAKCFSKLPLASANGMKIKNFNRAFDL